MANKILVGRATKARLETIKELLSNYELVYSIDTNEIGIKNNDGTITYIGQASELDWANITNKPTSFPSTIPLVTNLQTELNNRVTTATFNLQMMEKLNVKPNGTDDLVIAGKINSVYLDALYVTDVYVVASQSAMLALNAQQGDVAVRTDLNKTFILRQSPATTLANWVELLTPTDSVISVNGKTGIVVLGISDISGLQEQLNARVTTTVFETALDGKVDKNAAITAGTFTKITFDAKGLVTGGAGLNSNDVPLLPASKITSGVFDVARIPNLAISKITNLQTSLDNKINVGGIIDGGDL